MDNDYVVSVAGDDKLEKIFARFESLMPAVNETKLVTDMLWKAYEVCS